MMDRYDWLDWFVVAGISSVVVIAFLYLSGFRLIPFGGA